MGQGRAVVVKVKVKVGVEEDFAKVVGRVPVVAVCVRHAVERYLIKWVFPVFRWRAQIAVAR